MDIRPLTIDDAPRCAELEAQLFDGDSPWSAQAFVAEISHPASTYLGVFDDDALVGYAGIAQLGPDRDPEFEIHTIAVDPSYQRKGLGRALMNELTEIADAHDGELFLEVRTDNDPAIALYTAFGFATLGVRRGYYQPSGADAYTMSRPKRSQR